MIQYIAAFCTMALKLVVLALFLKITNKVSALPQEHHLRPCIQFMLPVQATAENAIYDILPVRNNIEATAYAVDLDTWDSRSSSDRLIKNLTVSGTYQISAQLCVPREGSKQTTLQIATHGKAFDKRYWDSAINPTEYSYVEAALEAGYSIFSYDRLGTGLSERPDGATIVQGPLQVEILRGITEMARSGELLKQASKMDRSFSSNHHLSFDKIIHIGHSFGSVLTAALLSSYGNLSDAAVLTGYIPSNQVKNNKMATLGLQYARRNDPHLFSNAGPGYVVIGTASQIQTGFFSARGNTAAGLGGFESAALDYAYSIRQTQTTGEGVSINEKGPSNAPAFEGPIQLVVGEFDYLVCAGDCTGTYDPSILDEIYPKASDINIHVQLGSGHGLTLHKGAKVGYKATLDWLHRNGL